jgi:hypothetical protein
MPNDPVTPTPGGIQTGAPGNADTQQDPGAPATRLQVRLLGLGLIVLAVLMAYLFLALWPSGFDPTATGSTVTIIPIFGQTVALSVTLDVRLVLMVMMAGGLGSFIHAATSFSDYVGNERLTSNWIWWYILRPFTGMILAVIFYLVIRGGFLSAGTEAGKINPFGIAALAGLVGMFSKQATDKLNEVFNTLFRTAPGEGDSKRKDNLTNPVPSVIDIEPKSVEPKTQNLDVGVKGTGFIDGAVVRVNGVNRETKFIDPTKLSATLLQEDVEHEGELEITIFNPGPGGGVSTPIKLKIAPNAGP